ncbi:peptidoglycan recognition protein family protein [Thalassococcus lentus]|uniref:Peptidoglycan recognition family protein n=1 Tax=Thalassococcus lentus TaxID=1210524 RepID=A0ABT4XWG0_9RHOB|nr:peptidoglycan recognition family protein [Thalassococcus lentus]MDA7426281.1 peptidoglycan recognition family protein [Thalassococcus lentus]
MILRILALAVLLVVNGVGVVRADALEILDRSQWGAAPAVTQRAKPIENRATGSRRVAAENAMPKRGEARYLTVHHTARTASAKPLAQNLKSFQRQMFSYRIDYGNGTEKQIFLGDLPYHFFISADGSIGEGRELRYAAYSNTTYSTPISQHITVVLDGNFERSEPTQEQLNALIALLDELSARFDIPLENIGGHRDVAQTLCPGKLLTRQMPAIIEAIKARRG